MIAVKWRWEQWSTDLTGSAVAWEWLTKNIMLVMFPPCADLHRPLTLSVVNLVRHFAIYRYPRLGAVSLDRAPIRSRFAPAAMAAASTCRPAGAAAGGVKPVVGRDGGHGGDPSQRSRRDRWARTSFGRLIARWVVPRSAPSWRTANCQLIWPFTDRFAWLMVLGW